MAQWGMATIMLDNLSLFSRVYMLERRIHAGCSLASIHVFVCVHVYRYNKHCLVFNLGAI